MEVSGQRKGGREGEGGRSPGGGGRALIFGFMSGGKGGLTSWLGDRYGGMLLPGCPSSPSWYHRRQQFLILKNDPYF